MEAFRRRRRRRELDPDELARPGRARHAQGALGHRRHHRPRHRRGVRRQGPELPRTARARHARTDELTARATRYAAGCAATSTCTRSGPTAAPRSRRWRATATELGHEYLAITDHSPQLTIARGLEPERLREQLDVIDALNAELAPFRILTGIEVDILDDGTLDQEDELLARLDVVVASVHSKLRMEERAMTARMITAIANPHMDILGHCTGRLIKGRGRPESTFDSELVFAACRELDKAVEVNCRPERLDPPRRHARDGRRDGREGRDRHRRPRAAASSPGTATAAPGWPRPTSGPTGSSTPGPLDDLLAWTASHEPPPPDSRESTRGIGTPGASSASRVRVRGGATTPSPGARVSEPVTASPSRAAGSPIAITPSTPATVASPSPRFSTTAWSIAAPVGEHAVRARRAPTTRRSRRSGWRVAVRDQVARQGEERVRVVALVGDVAREVTEAAATASTPASVNPPPGSVVHCIGVRTGSRPAYG